jgi:phosphoglycerate dehydrogenase-like enzyme
MDRGSFKVGFSADFLGEDRLLVFPDIGLSMLESDPLISYEFLDEYRGEYTSTQLDQYDVVISLKPRVTAESLRDLKRLCAIGRCGVGYDNVDVKACTEQDVALYTTPAGVVRPMASSIVLMILALSHNIVVKDRMMRQGEWTKSTRRLGREPRDRVVGTIGLGNIASEAFRLLKNFGVARFLAFDPYVTEAKAASAGVRMVLLDDLLRESDYVLINCPLTEKTRGLIGERELELMKPSAVLINTARGPIVNQHALVAALQSNKIAGAALDVFEKEPLERDSPLLQLDNVILTSHSIGWTEELFRDMGRIDCEGAIAISRGCVPESVVNREVLDRPGFKAKLEEYRKKHEAKT